ncbi:hypothetical protein AALC75_19525 [Lachnospiraceae bacterium 48-42]
MNRSAPTAAAIIFATFSEDSTMEIRYNVTGPRRKELATAVGDFIGTAPAAGFLVPTIFPRQFRI